MDKCIDRFPCIRRKFENFAVRSNLATTQTHKLNKTASHHRHRYHHRTKTLHISQPDSQSLALIQLSIASVLSSFPLIPISLWDNQPTCAPAFVLTYSVSG